MSIATNILVLRLLRGQTRTQLADRLGVHFETLSRWERGSCEPSASMVMRMAAELSVRPEALLDLERCVNAHERHATTGHGAPP